MSRMAAPLILHLIESVTRGGAARAAVAVAKYVKRSFPSHHVIAPIAVGRAEPEAVALAQANGLEVCVPASTDHLMALVGSADIVHLHWWNNPYVDSFLREALPAHRLIVWCHVGGHSPPQIVPDALIAFADRVVACSPYTYEAAAFRKLRPEIRMEKTSMVYGPADFERIGEVSRRHHEGFNVGYIGTVHFSKMHSQYVAMSADADIPGVRFIVCGGGGAEAAILREAQERRCAEKFELRGYIEDVRSVLADLDVYGYPLCPDNYSGSEINLQEAMFSGLPVVTFPYGGISRLVIDNFTGIWVESEYEYARALERLYRNPEERARLGANAKRYAEQIFGAAPAAAGFIEIYKKLLEGPKLVHQWPRDEVLAGVRLSSDPSDRFIASLGEHAKSFLISKYGATTAELLQSDNELVTMTELMRTGGVGLWRSAYPRDPFLTFWAGLGELGAGNFPTALAHFIDAAELKFNHWRIAWYLATAAERMGNHEAARQALRVIRDADPHFPGLSAFELRLSR